MGFQYIQMAFDVSVNAIGLSSPNPRVGCVIVKDEQIIGQGFTQAAGQAHAEIMAIRDAKNRGIEIAGSTAYVTLEPCSHHGRTPPCADALITERVSKVVIAHLDPNPQVAGRGVEKLRAAGIDVVVLPSAHPLAQAAYELNIGFMTRMEHQRVFTRMKWAQSADGKTALPSGQSQWITGEAARADGHHFRARADVLVSGIGTVLHDDPQLNVRGVGIVNPPIKCILDTWARLPLNARLWVDGAPVILVCAGVDAAHPQAGLIGARIALLQQQYPQLSVWRIPLLPKLVDEPDARADVIYERMNLALLWQRFYEAPFNEIHIEAGAAANGALLTAGLVDELLIYTAPRIMGAGAPTAVFAPQTQLDALAQETQWHWLDAVTVGADLRMRLRKNAI